MKRSRTRRNTTWMQASSKDAEDDASRNYSDFYAKEGIASQTKRVTLFTPVLTILLVLVLVWLTKKSTISRIC